MNNRYVLWAAATTILALIIHFCAVLSIPYLSENDAWKRLLNHSQANQMVLVDQLDEANKLWNFHATDVKYAICHYDITRGPVQVDFELFRGYWSVAIYDLEGKNFYAADGYDLLRRESSLLLLGPEQIKGNIEALTITVPDSEGILVIRAPIDNGVLESSALEMLKRAKCEQLPEQVAERRS